jgi:hypothetical protein
MQAKHFAVGGGGGHTAWSEKNCNTLESLHLHSAQETISLSDIPWITDADSIYLALNKTCPRCHLHTGNNETVALQCTAGQSPGGGGSLAHRSSLLSLMSSS